MVLLLLALYPSHPRCQTEVINTLRLLLTPSAGPVSKPPDLWDYEQDMKYSLFEQVEKALEKDERLVADGELLRNRIVELARKNDALLLKHLLADPQVRDAFFTDVEGVKVFDSGRFVRFVNNKEFLPDSYTAFKNKIGLAEGDEFVSENKDVVLNWPYKDCVLEGGQTKEDTKRDEIFWNETLAPDQIHRLLDPKVFTNWKRIDAKGEHKLDGLKVDENGDIKDNLIIKGNNLLALHSLKARFAGKIKLIYIDPPYNTGNDGFKYNDQFNHSTWLTFMRNRLEVARLLLAKEGSIFISIDNNELGYLQVLMDEIFGVGNRKNVITVRRSAISGAKVINPGVVNTSEFLLVYSRDSQFWKVNRVFRARGRDERYSSFIQNFSAPYSKWKFTSVLEGWAHELRIEKRLLKKHFGESYEEELEDFYYKNAHRIIQFASLDDAAVSNEVVQLKTVSQARPETVFRLQREGRLDYYILNGKVILFLVNKMLEIDGKKVFSEPLTDVWDDVLPNDIHNEGGVSLKKGKKPEKLLQRIIELTTSAGDMVLDYHLGSGTTAAVAHKMGRQYIGIEQLDYGTNSPIVRMQNVINGEESGVSKATLWKGGGNFVYAELMPLSQTFKEKVEKTRDERELTKEWSQIQEKGFLSYKLVLKNFDANAKDFTVLSFADQKRFILESLDYNQLYVNYSEMGDKDYAVTPVDKQLNKEFYDK